MAKVFHHWHRNLRQSFLSLPLQQITELGKIVYTLTDEVDLLMSCGHSPRLGKDCPEWMAVSCSLDYLRSPGMLVDSGKCTFRQPKRSVRSLFCLCLCLGLRRHSAARSGVFTTSLQNQFYLGGIECVTPMFLLYYIHLSYLPSSLKPGHFQANAPRLIILTLADC